MKPSPLSALFKIAIQSVPDSIPAAVSASASTLAASAACGLLENRNGIAPINAIAHMIYGEEAFGAAASTCTPRSLLRFTLPAVVGNTLAIWGWAIGHEVLAGRARGKSLNRSLACGALVSLVAYIVDYKLVSARWTPGIEAHLSKRSLFAVYVALALGLALGRGKRGP